MVVCTRVAAEKYSGAKIWLFACGFALTKLVFDFLFVWYASVSTSRLVLLNLYPEDCVYNYLKKSCFASKL